MEEPKLITGIHIIKALVSLIKVNLKVRLDESPWDGGEPIECCLGYSSFITFLSTAHATVTES